MGSAVWYDCIDPDDLLSEEKTEAVRERVLTMLDDLDPGPLDIEDDSNGATIRQSGSRIERFYSTLSQVDQVEVDEVAHFRRTFIDSVASSVVRKDSLADYGPWGNASRKGGNCNSWNEVDVSTYKVRGPNYLKNKEKVCGQGIGAELVVVDFYSVKSDIANVSEKPSVGTIQRLRRQGETRKLLVLNFRILPLQLVVVWALPEMNGENIPPALALLRRFMSEDMSNEERCRRIKVIPRMVDGPWVAKIAVGSTPAILGKNIPLDFFAGHNHFEVSVGIAKSSAARRILGVLKPAAAALNIEVVLVIEGQAADELPEEAIGGFRMTFADLGTLRCVE